MEKGIIDEYEDMTPQSRLQVMPKRILEREVDMMKCSERQEELLVKLKVLQTGKMDDVTKETSPEGKQKFTNDTSRKTEVAKRLKAHEGYQKVQSDHGKLVQQNKVNGIYLDYLKRIFRSAECIVRLGSR